MASVFQGLRDVRFARAAAPPANLGRPGEAESKRVAQVVLARENTGRLKYPSGVSRESHREFPHGVVIARQSEFPPTHAASAVSLPVPDTGAREDAQTFPGYALPPCGASHWHGVVTIRGSRHGYREFAGTSAIRFKSD